MAEEDFEADSYRSISDLNKELVAMKGKKDISVKDLYDTVQKLTGTMSDMLEVFGAAAEQLKLEEREYETDARKHEFIISRLDKIIDQNKTIAEGMVAIVDMIKEKILPLTRPKQESMFRPRPEPKPFMQSQQQEWQPEPKPFMRPQQQEWQPKPEPMMPRMQQPMPQPLTPQTMAPPISPPDFGMQMPPMQPTQPDFDLPEFPEEPSPAEQWPQKKGLFGMFKK
jgi:hypothetical protein